MTTKNDDHGFNRDALNELIKKRDALRLARDRGGLQAFPVAREQVLSEIKSLDARIEVLRRDLGEGAT